MTILKVVQDFCLPTGVGGITPPSTIFGSISSSRTMQEILALANEMAERIAYDTRDWQVLRRTQIFTGDGIKTAFDMPADYKRMLLTASVWRSTSPTVPMRFIPDTDEWLKRRAQTISDAYGEWTLLGGQMLIYPTLTTGQTVYFAYLHKNCITLAAGGASDVFQADADVFKIDERCLRLGMIWQWKAWKGSPYAEDLGSYGDALTSVMGRDSPAPIIIGRRPRSQALLGTAYPGLIPS
jgi:hypothetical protein